MNKNTNMIIAAIGSVLAKSTSQAHPPLNTQIKAYSFFFNPFAGHWKYSRRPIYSLSQIIC